MKMFKVKMLVSLFGLLMIFQFGQAQQIDYSLDGGFVAEGHDVVSYFSNKAVEGKSAYQTVHDGVKFKFSSTENLNKFKSNPAKYVPMYGGYCAYAMSAGKKADADPETFEVRDGKLYLFYNSWGINNLKKWLEEGPEKLKAKADQNWSKLKYKN